MALDSIAMKRSGAKAETMKTRGSTIGSAAITWLMLQVPAMIDASPGALTPEPSALAMTSKRPPTTGVPAARPVAAAASSLTPPMISVGPARSGSIPAASGMP